VQRPESAGALLDVLQSLQFKKPSDRDDNNVEAPRVEEHLEGESRANPTEDHTYRSPEDRTHLGTAHLEDDEKLHSDRSTGNVSIANT
jgi:hypothetical protein